MFFGYDRMIGRSADGKLGEVNVFLFSFVNSLGVGRINDGLKLFLKFYMGFSFELVLVMTYKNKLLSSFSIFSFYKYSILCFVTHLIILESIM